MSDRFEKPYPEFPLTASSNGYWCKVINGKQHRFGKRWCSPDDALSEYYRVKDEINEIGFCMPQSGGLTLREGMLAFLVSRKQRLEAGEIKQRTYDDYYSECVYTRDILQAQTPLASIGPRHFAKLRASYTGTPTVIANKIGRVRVIFKYMYDSELIPVPIRFGPDFRKPSVRVHRLHRAEQPKKLFTPAQVQSLIGNAKPQMAAMIYLGLFAGYGNEDCGTVQVRHIKGEWAEYHRPKTGLTRKAWLPEKAVMALAAIMPESGHVFVTKYGNPWSTGKKANPISAEFRKLARPLGINLGFYSLRHTCETVGGQCLDQVAVDHVMGHVVPGMAAVYREEVGDDRLKAVGQTIEGWLYS